MKQRTLVSSVIGLGLCVVSATYAGSGHVHRLDGSVATLDFVPSAITALFLHEISLEEVRALALQQPELSDDYDPWMLDERLYVLEVSADIDFDTAMARLRLLPSVGVVNPVVEGTDGSPVWLGDMIVVRFLPTTPQASVDSLHDELAAYVRPPDPHHPQRDIVHINPDLGLSALEVAELYYHSGLCRYAEPNFASHLILCGPQDADTVPGGEQFYGEQWHWVNDGQSGGVYDADIDADSAWMVTIGDPSVTVAVMDGGFDLYHEDWDLLSVWPGQDLADGGCLWDTCPEIGGTSAFQVYPRCTDTSIQVGHGTSVYGILSAAIDNEVGLRGLAPACNLLAVKCKSDCQQAAPLLLANSLGWTAQYADVICCPWGVPYYSSEIETTLAQIRADGIFVAFSTGNDGIIHFPSYLSSVTTVGATDDRDIVWPWSGRGDSLDFVAPSGNKEFAPSSRGYIWTKDMMADAGYVPDDVPSWQCDETEHYLCKMGGTSASVAEVAGIAGLLLSRRSDYKDSTDPAGLIRYVLEGSSEDKGGPGKDSLYGYGRVNAYRALLSVIRGDVTNDGDIDALDFALLTDMLFAGAHAVLDDRTGDWDCDGFLTALDLGGMIDYLYAGGPLPDICFAY